ncbi:MULTISPECIES: response regulator [unclassified Methylobacterium]|jgi:DNA-binding response OmpR family regulator|uniref:response regulator n=1 Tax=unclassified Methylobacterium TaxID=2615210 RepID=UPI0006FA883C|nr:MULTISPECIES: response regulator [unclassified Methylobacterium]KQO66162.1 response regulator receiver protein [Methylobacterium sp. Leaf89]KQO73205.1 response regulator receiver protein [Methylobacterium sp. Leaf88]KQP68763.1 response regulator receiver protein [Methylobacterium sp. Leaf111]KQT81825.1 response regulator receiver protein [Methylobacterium sp. Leaf465]KQU26364.1 response regulator receiver protein [Methylobacterium sp. Leaf94]
MSDTPAILIVDDQEKLLKLVILLMNRLGFPDVEGVTDAVTALERMRERRYALVISDLDMEPMDGLSFLREIRADDALMNTPFLLTEASFDFEDINLAHQAGADAFILKPFDMSVLKAKLKQVINRKPRRREAPLATESALSIDFPMLGKF